MMGYAGGRFCIYLTHNTTLKIYVFAPAVLLQYFLSAFTSTIVSLLISGNRMAISEQVITDARSNIRYS